MARFYADIQGNRGPATRMGSAASGITGYIRGWNVGVRIHIEPDADGKDHVYVYRTGGSNDPHADILVAEYT